MMEFQAMKHVRVLLAAAAVLVPVQLNAAGSTGELSFTANVVSECAIEILDPGALVYKSSKLITTEEIGGTRATARVTTNDASFALTVPAPSSWKTIDGNTPPPADDVFTTYTTLTNASSATNVANMSEELLGTGVTDASVGLQVSRDVDYFAPGAYVVDVDLTCA